jgi:CheY-like chemotaxis protein
MRILWLEDNEDDVFFMRTALKRSGLPATLQHVWNGKEALDFLARESALPDAILTDIRMPLLDGLGFIRELKQNPAWREIPVAILSTSGLGRDIRCGSELGVAGYFTKPNVPSDWVARLKEIYGEFVRLGVGSRRLETASV